MACNLNFNQCNGGCQFPHPIFNCRCRLLSILNSSEITIVNPIVTSSLVLSTIFPQNVDAGTKVSSNIAFSSGNAIDLTNGAFMIEEGRYLISYTASGRIGTNGVFSVAVEKDGVEIVGARSSTSGAVGETATLTNSAIVEVTTVASLLTLINDNSVSQELLSGNITIQKL